MIVTIIILTILACISIGILKSNEIFDKAKIAKAEYTNAQEQEDEKLKNYDNEIEEYSNISYAVISNREKTSEVYRKTGSDAEGASASKTIDTISVEYGDYFVIATFRADYVNNRQFFHVTGAGQNMPISGNGNTGTSIGYAENVDTIKLEYIKESGSYSHLFYDIIAIKLN